MDDNRKSRQTPPAGIPIWNSQVIMLAKNFQQTLQAFNFFQDFQVQQSFKIFILIMRRRYTELGKIQYTNDENFIHQKKRQYLDKIQNTNPRFFRETELIVPQMTQISNSNKEFWNNTQIKNEELNEKLINIKQSDESALSIKREQIKHEKRKEALEGHFRIKRRIGPELKDQSKKDQGKKMDYKQYREQNYSRVASKVIDSHGEISRAIQNEFKNTLILIHLLPE